MKNSPLPLAKAKTLPTRSAYRHPGGLVPNCAPAELPHSFTRPRGLRAPCSPLCRLSCQAGSLPASWHSLPFSVCWAARFARPSTKHGAMWARSADCLAFTARRVDSGILSSVPLNLARAPISSQNESYKILAVSLFLTKENPSSYTAVPLLLRCKDNVQTCFLSYVLQKHWRRSIYINTELVL